MFETHADEPQTGGTRVIDREEQQDVQAPKRHNVILWNDEFHTATYVVRMLQELFKHPPDTAFKLMEEVHEHGRAIVFTGMLEQAEFKRDQITAYGKDHAVAGCEGAMSATIEST